MGTIIDKIALEEAKKQKAEIVKSNKIVTK